MGTGWCWARLSISVVVVEFAKKGHPFLDNGIAVEKKYRSDCVPVLGIQA